MIFRSKQKRHLFRFEADGRQRYADPVRAIGMLVAAPDFDLERDGGLLEVEDQKVAAGARARCAMAARLAFNLEEFNDSNGRPHGVTELECLQILNEFSVYLDALKKNGSLRRT